MKKSQFAILLAVIVLCAGVIFGYVKYRLDNDKQVNNNKTEETNMHAIISIYQDDDKGGLYGIDSQGNESLLVNKDEYRHSYTDYTVASDALYYVDKDYYIHKISFKTKINEKLSIKINENYWGYIADGEYLISNGEDNNWYDEIYNLKTGRVERLPLVSNGSRYFIYGNYYYSDNDSNALKYYNVNTNKINSINENSHIIYAEGNYIIYARGNYIEYDKNNDGVFVLDAKTNTFTSIKGIDYEKDIRAGSHITEFDIIGDDVYYFKHNGNTLNKYSANGEYSQVLDLKEDEKYKTVFYSLVQKHSPYVITIEADLHECLVTIDDYCEPAVRKYYYYNVINNSLNTNEINCPNCK